MTNLFKKNNTTTQDPPPIPTITIDIPTTSLEDHKLGIRRSSSSSSILQNQQNGSTTPTNNTRGSESTTSSSLSNDVVIRVDGIRKADHEQTPMAPKTWKKCITTYVECLTLFVLVFAFVFSAVLLIAVFFMIMFYDDVWCIFCLK